MDQKTMRRLRSAAHHLKPVVRIGDKGLTENVLAEIDLALNAHELIKISIAGADRAERQTMTDDICERMEATKIQMIGRISILHRVKREETNKKDG